MVIWACCGKKIDEEDGETLYILDDNWAELDDTYSICREHYDTFGINSRPEIRREYCGVLGYAFYCQAHQRWEVGGSRMPYDLRSGGYACRANDVDVTVCEECGNVWLEDSDGEPQWCDDYDGGDGGFLCDDCREEFDEEDGVIDNYGYKPAPEFYNSYTDHDWREKKETLYLGVELETDDSTDRCDMAQEIKDEFPMVYAKEDCSLNDYTGVEFVTHPLAADFAVNGFDWNRFRAICREYNAVSDKSSNCGLHVHMNRTFFEGASDDETDLNIAKLIFLYNRFFDQWCKFSRRRSYQIERWANKNDRYTDYAARKETAIAQKKECDNAGRYHAVNLENWSTIEIRLWKGSLNVDTIRATLDATQAIANLAVKLTLRKIANIDSWDKMRVMLLGEALDPENLAGYLAKRNLMEGDGHDAE